MPTAAATTAAATSAAVAATTAAGTSAVAATTAAATSAAVAGTSAAGTSAAAATSRPRPLARLPGLGRRSQVVTLRREDHLEVAAQRVGAHVVDESVRVRACLAEQAPCGAALGAVVNLGDLAADIAKALLPGRARVLDLRLDFGAPAAADGQPADAGMVGDQAGVRGARRRQELVPVAGRRDADLPVELTGPDGRRAAESARSVRLRGAG